jgi:hypothetical protein
VRGILLLTLVAGSLLAQRPATAHGPATLAAGDHPHRAVVSVARDAGTGRGTLEVEVSPADAWRGSLFVSLYQGPFHERKEIRPDDSGRYRLEVRLPQAGQWGVYLRYGLAQAGYAGSGRLTIPEGGAVATELSLHRGFSGDVPGYVQPLGFLAFALVAGLTVLGLGVLLQRIRASQSRPAGRSA